MNGIEGMNLQCIVAEARKGFQKQADSRLKDYVRGLLFQAHNLEMKSERLRQEAAQSDAQLATIKDKIAKIESGDWSVIDPIELQDKQDKGDKN
jgi:6-phosphogluconate dehydrogenase (decarboxylating)